MPVARRRDREPVEELDVPAAVVCALCGDAECPGCANEPSRSGVVAVVAWERPGAPFFPRLWATARAATLDPDRFFEALPDGPIAPALRFAVVCDLVAVSTGLSLVVVVAALIAPVYFGVELLARFFVLAVPAIALLLVAVNAVRGYALDRSARRAAVAGRGSSTRGLRFGLYTAGWDLVLCPLGAVVLAFKEGLRAALRLAALIVRLRSLNARTALAFLRGSYRLEGASAQVALRASVVAATVTMLLGVAILLAAGFLALK